MTIYITESIIKCKAIKFVRWSAFCIFFGSPLVDNSISAQDQKAWQWVKQLGSKSWDISAGIAIDSTDNLYVAGSFSDKLQCHTTEVASAGSRDIFIAKFNNTGTLKEIISAGGKSEDQVTCLCSSTGNNLVIGGMVSDTAEFQNINVNGSGQSLFVAAMDGTAKFRWVSAIEIKGEASLYLIGSDKKGNVFASGFFTGTLNANDHIVTSKGKSDIFIVRLSSSGNIEKLSSFGSEEDDSPASLTVDSSGDVILSGTFGKTFETGNVKFLSSQRSAKTNSFIALFDNDFSAKWANILEGFGYTKIASLKTDSYGNIYGAGSYSSALHAGNTVLKSVGFTDAFLLKYKPDGLLEWSKSFGSSYYDYATTINIDNLGGAIISGSVGDTLTIDSLAIEPNLRGDAAVLIQFSPTGKAIWADCISGTGRNFSEGSVLDKQGNLYFTGSFKDIFEKGNDALTSHGDQDVFIAKYFNCPSQKAEILGELNYCPGTETNLRVKKGFTNIIWNDTIIGKNSINANKPGRYWVRMLDKMGCMLSDTVQVRQASIPFFSLGRDTIMQVSDSLIFHAPAKYKNFIWNDFSFGEDYLVKSPQNKTGTYEYWLSVSDSLSCTYTDTISVTFVKDNDWVELDKVQLVTYPNPADDRFFWYVITDETCQLVAELTDSYGRILYHHYFKQYLSGEVKEVSLSNMPSGFYNLKISNSTSFESFKTVRVIKK